MARRRQSIVHLDRVGSIPKLQGHLPEMLCNQTESQKQKIGEEYRTKEVFPLPRQLYVKSANCSDHFRSSLKSRAWAEGGPFIVGPSAT